MSVGRCRVSVYDSFPLTLFVCERYLVYGLPCVALAVEVRRVMRHHDFAMGNEAAVQIRHEAPAGPHAAR